MVEAVVIDVCFTVERSFSKATSNGDDIQGRIFDAYDYMGRKQHQIAQ
jgi:hypothetical protein